LGYSESDNNTGVTEMIESFMISCVQIDSIGAFMFFWQKNDNTSC